MVLFADFCGQYETLERKKFEDQHYDSRIIVYESDV